VHWETILTSFNLFIPLPPLVHDDVDNFVLLADVLRGYGHETIDDFIE
jgi:hypothetical protein